MPKLIGAGIDTGVDQQEPASRMWRLGSKEECAPSGLVHQHATLAGMCTIFLHRLPTVFSHRISTIGLHRIRCRSEQLRCRYVHE